jgi:hypothetical protein
METTERDQLIGRLLQEGNTLSDVQKVLEEEHGVKLTYMELRLISSELEVNWSAFDPPEPKPVLAEPDVLDAPGPSKTTVTVSKIQRPGAVASGDVTFASGATAEWHFDAMGRLALDPTGSGERPTEEDVQEFQAELQTVMQGKM